MKFVHIADIHFDRPFVNLASKQNVGELKRLEQRKVFKEIINYIKENKIEIFFISGDLYEERYIKQSTIDFINDLFKQIPDTKIYITPGNHDPKIKNSFYNNYNWNNNVKIFDSQIEKVKLNDQINIYGYGFNDYYCTDCGIEDFEIPQEEKSKTNILVIHASLNAASLEEKQYNSISENDLKQKGFDYIALGHIHKSNFDISNKIVYPGSPTSLRFEKNEKYGMVVGDIQKDNISIEFIELDGKKFEERDVFIEDIKSEEELIEKLNEIENENKNFLKIVLQGKRNFEIDLIKIKDLIQNEEIIKIYDNTKMAIDLEDIENNFTLKGIFAKEMKAKLLSAKTPEEKKEIERAIEIGLDALN